MKRQFQVYASQLQELRVGRTGVLRDSTLLPLLRRPLFIHSESLITWTFDAELVSTKAGTDINMHIQTKRTCVALKITQL